MSLKRFILLESLSDSTKKAFDSVYKKLWSSLVDVADVINNDSKASDDMDSLVKTIRQIATDTIVALDASTADTVKNQAFQDCLSKLDNLQQNALLKAHTDFNNAVNEATNSLKALSNTILNNNSYANITDVLSKLSTACTEKLVNTDQNLDRETLNRTGYILQRAKKAVGTDDLKLTDTVVADFITECNNLLKQLGAKDWTKLKEFNEYWDNTFAAKFNASSSNISTTNTADDLEDIGSQKRDWAKDFAKASEVESYKLWQEFLKAEFGKNAEFVKKIGRNVQYVCMQKGYSLETNPYLYFINNFALSKDSVRLPLTAVSFYRIAYAIQRNSLAEADLMTNPNASLNLINCKQFYSQSSEIMTQLLELQHLFKTETCTATSAILNAPVLGPWLSALDKQVGTEFKLTEAEVAELLYHDYSSEISSSYNLKLNSIQQVQDAANLLFGARANRSGSTNAANGLTAIMQKIKQSSKSDIMRLWPDMFNNNNTRQADILLMLTLVYLVNHPIKGTLGVEADKLQTWEPKNNDTHKYLQQETKCSTVAQAIKSPDIEKVLDSILQNTDKLAQFKPSGTSIQQWLTQLDDRIAKSKLLSDED